jgi:hypothetical protein
LRHKGVLEELDAVNEYYYQPSTGRLFFMPNTSDAHPDGLVSSETTQGRKATFIELRRERERERKGEKKVEGDEEIVPLNS